MKYLMVLLILVSVISCKQKENNSLEPLKIDYIGNIPFLMNQMKIDSVLEIVTFGQLGSAKEGETYNRYVLDKNNTVKQKLKSFMCCSRSFKFDSLGFLIYKSNFTDFLKEYYKTYERNGNKIIELKKDSYNNDKRFAYHINNENVVLKTSLNIVDSAYVEKVKYHYNGSKLLTKKTVETKNHDEDLSDYNKIVTTYFWKNDILSKTIEMQYFKNGIDFYETITQFDSVGFPVSKTVNKNKDIVCETIMQRF